MCVESQGRNQPCLICTSDVSQHTVERYKGESNSVRHSVCDSVQEEKEGVSELCTSKTPVACSAGPLA
jgi:hypothetical protein